MQKPEDDTDRQAAICLDAAVASSVAGDEGKERATHGRGLDNYNTPHRHLTSPHFISSHLTSPLMNAYYARRLSGEDMFFCACISAP